VDKIRILLTDDQELFVENLRIVIEAKTDDMEVVGIARDGYQALSMLAVYPVDIVLLDVRMPNLDGVETAKKILELYPAIRIIMLTTFDDDDYVHQALGYGVAGYLLKNIPPEELFSSVRAVHQGSLSLAPTVMRKILHKVPQARAADGQGNEDAKKRIALLTFREEQIMKLLYRAYDNRQIAEKLNIAEQTVKNHVHVIYSKMGVAKRAQLMKLLSEHD
jgi:DNA-binding NarL/FixJ family response regulator